MARSRLILNEVSSSGKLTGPHQTSFSVSGCRTTRLSLGERPVFCPGVGDQRTAVGDRGARFVANRFLVQPRRSGISQDIANRDSMTRQTK